MGEPWNIGVPEIAFQERQPLLHEVHHWLAEDALGV
jgi:hypothetical protein